MKVGVNTNIRALAVNDSLNWWFGGSGGWLGHTADGGKSWELHQPAGSAVDFRSIHAFNQQEAVAAIAGQPAKIYRTQNGGKAWELVHWLKDTSAFIDAIGFWNAQDGLLFGDPLGDGRMLLLRTSDGGRSWEALPDSSRPQLYPGEAAFAASGTAMQCVGDSTVAIVSGGSRSRLFVSHNRGRTWEVVAADRWQPGPNVWDKQAQTEFGLMQHGSASKGAFSVGFSPDSQWVLTGGDYLQDTSASGNFLIRGRDFWWRARQAPRGYRECVAFIAEHIWVVTGPAGSDISWNGGLDWQQLNDFDGMHVVKKLGNGLLLAGKGGVLLHYEGFISPLVPDKVGRGTMTIVRKNILNEVHKRRKPKLNSSGVYSFDETYRELDTIISCMPGVVSWKELPTPKPSFACHDLPAKNYALVLNTSEGEHSILVTFLEGHMRNGLIKGYHFHLKLTLDKFESSATLERDWQRQHAKRLQLAWKLAE
ncbi:MAG: hypothetical protein Q8J69_11430 [Sphingobacteriaceae bacterium]|nr:hypothetical protein [Sphingobacteriaceae bacterium]